ncbi:MAG: F-type H+-transporting ATPase subunit b [Candidatus Poriferisodalaceae bacterium]|jgi:F-type H+-transporting ATPase subunit b
MQNLMILASEEPNNPILPATNEIIWGGIAFFILLLLLSKLAYPALRDAMNARSEKIRSQLDEAEQAQANAVAMRGEYDQKIAEAQAEASSIIDAARQEAEAVRAERIGAIDGEIAERRAQADADIESAKTRALADVSSQVTTLAVGAAEKVVLRSLDQAAYSQLIDDYINQVATQG